TRQSFIHFVLLNAKGKKIQCVLVFFSHTLPQRYDYFLKPPNDFREKFLLADAFITYQSPTQRVDEKMTSHFYLDV
ncbi:MAG: hypothetical protein IJL82_05315, partial [Prevotella sp.]|nr:hypothetical protein [Prevotella sp.]